MRLVKFERLADEDIYINVDEIEALEQVKSTPDFPAQTIIRMCNRSEAGHYLVLGKVEDVVKKSELQSLNEALGGILGGNLF